MTAVMGLVLACIVLFILLVILGCVSLLDEDIRRSNRVDQYVREEFWGNCHSVFDVRYDRRDAAFCNNCSGYKKCCEEAEAELIRKGLLAQRKEKKKK